MTLQPPPIDFPSDKLALHHLINEAIKIAPTSSEVAKQFVHGNIQRLVDALPDNWTASAAKADNVDVQVAEAASQS